MEIKKLKDRLHMFTTTPKDDVMSDNRNLENNLNLDNDNLDDVFRKLKDVLRFRFENREEIPESSKSRHTKSYEVIQLPRASSAQKLS